MPAEVAFNETNIDVQKGLKSDIPNARPMVTPFLTYTDVTVEDLEMLLASRLKSHKTEQKLYLAKNCMQLDQEHAEETFPFEIAADYYYSNFAFCVERGFDYAKISTFLSIMRTVYQKAFQVGMSMEESFELFKTQLLKHACHRPPFSCGVFSMDDVAICTEFALDTFYRHYKMYRYVYFVERELDVRIIPEVATVVKTMELPTMTCSPANEVDPREQDEIAELFEEERRQAEIRRKREEEAARKAALMGFEERVLNQVHALETKVDAKLTELQKHEGQEEE